MRILVPHFLQTRENTFSAIHFSLGCPVSAPHVGQTRFFSASIFTLLWDWCGCDKSILSLKEGFFNQGGEA